MVGISSSTKDIDREIGKRIQGQRVAAGFTQLALASALGVSTVQVYRFECGSHRISVGTLLRIAAALEINHSIFLAGLQEKAATTLHVAGDC